MNTNVNNVKISRKEKRKIKKDARAQKLKKTWYGKIFYFIWYDDSAISWLVNIVLAFIFIKFIFYPLLGVVFATPIPVVAVVSCSMEHGYTNCGELKAPVDLCGVEGSGKADFDEFWNNCKSFYISKNITKQEFKNFPMHNGFNKGEIILLKGVDLEDIKIGDIIVFNANKNYPIIHRVIENNNTLQTKGDNNEYQISIPTLNEKNITKEQILGKAIARVPFLGYIKIWATEFIYMFR